MFFAYSLCAGASKSKAKSKVNEKYADNKAPSNKRCKCIDTDRLPTWFPGSTKRIVAQPDLEFSRTFPAKGDSKSSPLENVFRPKPCPFLHRDKLSLDIKETEFLFFTRTYRYYVVFPFAANQPALKGDIYGTKKFYDAFDGNETTMLNKADVVQISKKCKGTCGWLKQKIYGYIGLGPMATELVQELSQRPETSSWFEWLTVFNKLFTCLLGIWAFIVTGQTWPWEAEFWNMFGVGLASEEDLADQLLCYGCEGRGLWENILDRDQEMQEGLELAIFGGLLNAFGSGVPETKDMPEDDTAGEVHPHDVEFVWHTDDADVNGDGANDSDTENGGGSSRRNSSSGGGAGSALRRRHRAFEVLPAYFGPQSWASIENEMIISYEHWKNLARRQPSDRVFTTGPINLNEIPGLRILKGQDVQIVSIFSIKSSGMLKEEELASMIEYAKQQNRALLDTVPQSGPFIITCKRKYVVAIDDDDIKNKKKTDRTEDATLCLKMARDVSLDAQSLAVVFARSESHYITAIRGAKPGLPDNKSDIDINTYAPLDKMHITWQLPLHTRSGMQIERAWRTATQEQGELEILYEDIDEQIKSRPVQRPRISELPTGQFIHKISSAVCDPSSGDCKFMHIREGTPLPESGERKTRTSAMCTMCPTVLDEMRNCITDIFGADNSLRSTSAGPAPRLTAYDIVLDRHGERITGKMQCADADALVFGFPSRNKAGVRVEKLEKVGRKVSLLRELDSALHSVGALASLHTTKGHETQLQKDVWDMLRGDVHTANMGSVANKHGGTNENEMSWFVVDLGSTQNVCSFRLRGARNSQMAPLTFNIQARLGQMRPWEQVCTLPSQDVYGTEGYTHEKKLDQDTPMRYVMVSAAVTATGGRECGFWLQSFTPVIDDEVQIDDHIVEIRGLERLPWQPINIKQTMAAHISNHVLRHYGIRAQLVQKKQVIFFQNSDSSGWEQSFGTGGLFRAERVYSEEQLKNKVTGVNHADARAMWVSEGTIAILYQDGMAGAPATTSRVYRQGEYVLSKGAFKALEVAVDPQFKCLCSECNPNQTIRQLKAWEEEWPPSLLVDMKQYNFGESPTSLKLSPKQVAKPAVMIKAIDSKTKAILEKIKAFAHVQGVDGKHQPAGGRPQFVTVRDQSQCETPDVRITDYMTGEIAIGSDLYEAEVSWSNTAVDLSRKKDDKLNPTTFYFGRCKPNGPSYTFDQDPSSGANDYKVISNSGISVGDKFTLPPFKTDFWKVKVTASGGKVDVYDAVHVMEPPHAEGVLFIINPPAKVVLYEKDDFTGWSAVCEEGLHTLHELKGKGVAGASVAAITVPHGLKATLIGRNGQKQIFKAAGNDDKIGKTDGMQERLDKLGPIKTLQVSAIGEEGHTIFDHRTDAFLHDTLEDVQEPSGSVLSSKSRGKIDSTLLKHASVKARSYLGGTPVSFKVNSKPITIYSMARAAGRQNSHVAKTTLASCAKPKIGWSSPQCPQCKGYEEHTVSDTLEQEQCRCTCDHSLQFVFTHGDTHGDHTKESTRLHLLSSEAGEVISRVTITRGDPYILEESVRAAEMDANEPVSTRASFAAGAYTAKELTVEEDNRSHSGFGRFGLFDRDRLPRSLTLLVPKGMTATCFADDDCEGQHETYHEGAHTVYPERVVSMEVTGPVYIPEYQSSWERLKPLNTSGVSGLAFCISDAISESRQGASLSSVLGSAAVSWLE